MNVAVTIDQRKIVEGTIRSDRLAVEADPQPAMTTIPNITLAEAGEWDASTGTVTFTPDDLRAMIAALDDPAIKAPRLRFGHTSWDTSVQGSQGYMDDQPVVGKFVNLRLGPNDMSLVGDLAGVPKWLADILPVAYPNRSVEVYWDVETKTGNKHDAVLASVAVLGVSLPAVATLEDLAVLFSAEGPDGVEVVQMGDRVAARVGDSPARVAASVQYEDVRRAFYSDFATEESGRYWWWIQAMYVNPPLLVVADEEDNLYAVSYSTAGDGVEFGDPQAVKQQFADDSGKVLARKSKPEQQHRTAAESRPAERKRPKEVKAMDPQELRRRLGLAEDAPDDEVNKALETRGESAPADPPDTGDEGDESGSGAPEEGTSAPTPPEPAHAETVQVDRDTWETIQRQAALGAQAAERQRIEDRDRFLTEEGVKAGRFAPSRLAHWQKLFDRDPEGTRATILGLQRGLIPVEQQGSEHTGEGTDAAANSEYDVSMLSPRERARAQAAREGKLDTPRITVEA